MTRKKKKFQPAKDLEQVFDAIDQRRGSARSKFLARKSGLEEKKKKKELMKAEKEATTESKPVRKTRLKKDPAQIAEQAKEIIDSAKAK